MKNLSAPSRDHAAKAVAAILLSIVGLLLACAQSAQALPSFARQTGQQCAACHNGFPELTPYGRQFKLNGYTFANGNGPVLPIAALIIDSFTHTSESANAPVVPGTSQNDNLVLDAAALFYAGKIFDNVGAYVAGAYSQLSHRFTLAQSDIRYADNAKLFGKDTTFGLSVNNNPALTDPWNTAQAFYSYPYENSHVVVSPVASTAIQGRYANQVIGVNGYLSWNQLVYAAAGLYRSIDPGTLDSLGINTHGATTINGMSPYWRIALEPAWGNNTLEVGVLGMAMSVNPRRFTNAGTDRTIDVGVDTEYQYLEDENSFSAMSSYIVEHSSLNASKALGFSSNARDRFGTLNTKGTYTYDQTYAANLGYFRTGGSRDQALYGGAGGGANGSPNSAAWTGEIDYYPFNRGGPQFWRELGLKFGLQYVYYTRFDGGTVNYDGFGRSASANDTLFLYMWTAF